MTAVVGGRFGYTCAVGCILGPMIGRFAGNDFYIADAQMVYIRHASRTGELIHIEWPETRIRGLAISRTPECGHLPAFCHDTGLQGHPQSDQSA